MIDRRSFLKYAGLVPLIAWLASTFGVRFVTLAELSAMV
jgi:hypothetical protein